MQGRLGWESSLFQSGSLPLPTDEGLWGPASSQQLVSAPHTRGFEDSFCPHDDTPSTLQSSYVPLDDSSQYLQGLERKLARVQGHAASHRKSESRRLIDALAGSRSNHTSQFLNDTSAPTTEPPTQDQSGTNSTTAAVDPQGVVGAVLRRVAPDKIALDPEELRHLLDADVLASLHSILVQATGEEGSCGSGDTSHKPDTTDPSAHTVKTQLDLKEQSSDEGEK